MSSHLWWTLTCSWVLATFRWNHNTQARCLSFLNLDFPSHPSTCPVLEVYKCASVHILSTRGSQGPVGCGLPDVQDSTPETPDPSPVLADGGAESLGQPLPLLLRSKYTHVVHKSPPVPEVAPGSFEKVKYLCHLAHHYLEEPLSSWNTRPRV